MGVNNNYNSKVAYGLSQAYFTVFPAPIVSARSPLGTDTAPIGQLWIVPSTNSIFTLTSVVAGVANWEGGGGGAGTFTALTVTPGPISLTGALTLTSGASATNIASDASTGAVNIGTGAGARNITIGNVTGATLVDINTGTGGAVITTTNGVFTVATGTGTISIGGDNGAKAIQIGNAGTGVKTISIGTSALANVITIGSTTGAASLQLKAGTAGIALVSGGELAVQQAAGTNTTQAITINANMGVATFSSQTFASAGTSKAYTITCSSLATISGGLLVTVSSDTSATTAALSLAYVTVAAGSFVVGVTCNGTGFTGNVIITFWALGN